MLKLNYLQSAINQASESLEFTQKTIEETISKIEEEQPITITPEEEPKTERTGLTPSPTIFGLMLSDWFPDAGKEFTISSRVTFCKDSSEMVTVRVYYPDGSIFYDRNVSMNSSCEFETTVKMPMETISGVWNITAQAPSTNERFTIFMMPFE